MRARAFNAQGEQAKVGRTSSTNQSEGELTENEEIITIAQNNDTDENQRGEQNATQIRRRPTVTTGDDQITIDADRDQDPRGQMRQGRGEKGQNATNQFRGVENGRVAKQSIDVFTRPHANEENIDQGHHGQILTGGILREFSTEENAKAERVADRSPD